MKNFDELIRSAQPPQSLIDHISQKAAKVPQTPLIKKKSENDDSDYERATSKTLSSYQKSVDTQKLEEQKKSTEPHEHQRKSITRHKRATLKSKPIEEPILTPEERIKLNMKLIFSDYSKRTNQAQVGSKPKSFDIIQQ